MISYVARQPRSRVSTGLRSSSSATSQVATRDVRSGETRFEIPITFNPQRKESYEVSSPFPEPVAVSQWLQGKSCDPNPPDGEVELQLSSGALRVETRNHQL